MDPAVPGVPARQEQLLLSLTWLRAGMVLGSHRSSVLVEQRGAGHRSARCLLAAHQHPPATKARTNTFCSDQHLHRPVPFAPANTDTPARAVPLPGSPSHGPGQLPFQSFLLSPSYSSRFGTPPGTWEQVPGPFGSVVFGCSQAASPPLPRWVMSSPSPSWGGTSSGARAEQRWKR